MAAPHSPLVKAFHQLETEHGSVPFDAFMDLVLYHPTLGYYARSSERPARTGDFLTSAELTPLFGAVVAAWCDKVWRRMGAGSLAIVEVGAGRGTLAGPLLDALPDPLRKRVTLHLVEQGAAPRQKLEERFRSDMENGRVLVHAHVEALPPAVPAGVFIANEMFDNLPVRRVMRAGALQEIRLRYQRGRIVEVLEPCPPVVERALNEGGLRLGEGQSCEVSLRAAPLMESVLARFEQGAFVVFDYGGEARDVSGEAAPQGTLLSFRGHVVSRDLYAHLGDQDVTARVNFTPLRQAALRLGYNDARLDSQSRFLVENGLPELVTERIRTHADEFEKLRLTQAAKQLYHPEGMGEAFRVLHGVKADS